jgi:hypothetical protein
MTINLSYLYSLPYKVIHIEILHVCSIYHWLPLGLTSYFFETLKDDIFHLKNIMLRVARPPIIYNVVEICYEQRTPQSRR